MKSTCSISKNLVNTRFGCVIICLAVLVLFYPYPACTQPTSWQQKKVDSLFAQWNNPQSPGMEVLILHKGKILMNKGYGLANIERQIPNSSKGRIWVASMSKQFTALAIAILVDRQKIRLEDDIRKYLPEILFLGDTIRIKNLVYHTSGLRDGFVLTGMSFKAENEYTNENVIKYLSRQKGRNYKPGERFEYNNGGYVLLATIVERVSRKSFPDFIEENIFRPLGMNQSRFYGQFPEQDSSIVTGYSVFTSNNNSVYRPVFFKGNSYGSTGLITTAEDLAKWDRIFYEPVFGKSVQQLQLQTGKLNSGASIPYGLGLEIEDFKGKKAISHSGVDAGYKSEMIRFPDDQLTVICLANTEDAYNNTDRLFKVAEIFIEFDKAKPVPSTVLCRPKEGSYINRANLASMRFIHGGTNPTVSTSPTGYKQVLEPEQNCLYAVKDIQTDSYDFHNNSFHYSTRGSKEVYEKINQASPDTTVLKNLAGVYYSEELDVNYNLFVKEGVLYLKFFDTYDVPLIAYQGGLFVGEFLGHNVLKIVKGKSDAITGIEFNREGIHALFFRRK